MRFIYSTHCDLKVFALQQLQNKALDGVGQITAVHQWGHTAGAEQMLSWLILEDGHMGNS